MEEMKLSKSVLTSNIQRVVGDDALFCQACSCRQILVKEQPGGSCVITKETHKMSTNGGVERGGVAVRQPIATDRRKQASTPP